MKEAPYLPDISSQDPWEVEKPTYSPKKPKRYDSFDALRKESLIILAPLEKLSRGEHDPNPSDSGYLRRCAFLRYVQTAVQQLVDRAAKLENDLPCYSKKPFTLDAAILLEEAHIKDEMFDEVEKLGTPNQHPDYKALPAFVQSCLYAINAVSIACRRYLLELLSLLVNDAREKMKIDFK